LAAQNNSWEKNIAATTEGSILNSKNPQETKETKSCLAQFELEAVVATTKGPHGSSSCFLSSCF